MKASTDGAALTRLRMSIRGAVQGVGFRPFVFRLASELKLGGWVRNSPAGVVIEAEGPADRVEEFRRRLPLEKPGLSLIQSVADERLSPLGEQTFTIRQSEADGAKSALVLPDIATCPDCFREIFDPANRRHGYAFTNCTNCGPRFSIIEALPYDRPNTTMRGFTMCPECRAEYENPADRRFHAQPNACPACGPRLEWWDAAGTPVALTNAAQASRLQAQSKNSGGTPVLLSSGPLLIAAEALRAGRIVAVKGLGGFHLMVAAHLDESVERLRRLKHREEKPFALMFPTFDDVREHCAVSELEAQLLTSPQAPIVLLRRKEIPHSACLIPYSVAPRNPHLGAMLPSTPLHHLLLRELGFAVVATSGNLSDEPICTDEREAVRRLGGIADFFLVHNRPIARHVDDSVVRVVAGREMVLRRARGYAPLPVVLPEAPPAALAVGAHLKNTVAVSVGPQVFLSQHIGDLETEEALGAFRRVAADLQIFYDVRLTVVACDAHPDYLSTQFSRQSGLPVKPVQHHFAHVLACLAEHGATGDALGVSWDGTGFGDDGTIWGGEFLRVHETGFTRVAHLRTFRLPGGEMAVKEPRRSAVGLLFEIFGEEIFAKTAILSRLDFSEAEIRTLRPMLAHGVNAPVTSSAGRLFDAVAALCGVRQRASFEGQAAMELEWAIKQGQGGAAYPIDLKQSAGTEPWVLDWEPMVRAILNDAAGEVALGEISRRFHDALVEAIVAVAQRIALPLVALSGGCFQNLYLAERAIFRLREAGFLPLWHRHVPPNDGGIALGQMAALLRGSD